MPLGFFGGAQPLEMLPELRDRRFELVPGCLALARGLIRSTFSSVYRGFRCAHRYV
jgi:hypothetical protein